MENVTISTGTCEVYRLLSDDERMQGALGAIAMYERLMPEGEAREALREVKEWLDGTRGRVRIY